MGNRERVQDRNMLYVLLVNGTFNFTLTFNNHALCHLKRYKYLN